MFNLLLHTHDEDYFHHPQILKIASIHTPNGFSTEVKKIRTFIKK